jgi:hypothetical protein
VPTFDEAKNQNTALIRKALGGAFFLGEEDATAITALTTYTAAVTGPPAVPEKIELLDLEAAGYFDVGYLTDDGIQFSNETSQSDVSSWQSTQPTRSDIISDTDTLTVVMQETNIQTLGLFTGADVAAITLGTNTSELGIAKPERPAARFYRGLALAVDGEGAGEFFIGRYYPRLKVTGRNDQQYGKGDDPISWGVTMTAFVDATLGYSSKLVFGGRGWKAKIADMGLA